MTSKDLGKNPPILTILENNKFTPSSNCPYAGSECSVRVISLLLLGILRRITRLTCTMGVPSTIDMLKANPNEVENATWMLTVFNCFGRQLCLHFEAFQLGMAPVYDSWVMTLWLRNSAIVWKSVGDKWP